MLIGELAAQTGVAARTLRFYEHQGLLHEPARTAGGYRDYEPAARDRVRFIKRAQHAGLTLSQIREILTVRDDGRPPCRHVEALVIERLDVVEQRLAELQRVRTELISLRGRLADLDASDCTPDRICTALDGAPRRSATRRD